MWIKISARLLRCDLCAGLDQRCKKLIEQAVLYLAEVVLGKWRTVYVDRPLHQRVFVREEAGNEDVRSGNDDATIVHKNPKITNDVL